MPPASPSKAPVPKGRDAPSPIQGSGSDDEDEDTTTAIFDPLAPKPLRTISAKHASGPVPLPPSLPPAPAPVVKSVSMKTPAELAAEKKPQQPQREIPKVHIRPLRAQTQPGPHELGTVAPPRDPKAARERHAWSLVFWASIVVIIASLVALAVWLIAR